MHKTIDEAVKSALGEQALAIISLKFQLEQAQAKIKELEQPPAQET